MTREIDDMRPAARVSLLADTFRHHLVNAIVAFIFATTGPVAILLAAGAKTGLSGTELASWIFGAFFINGVLSLVACLVYRQPLVFLWTIPGSVLVGTAASNLSFPEIVGAYTLTGAALLLIGVSGLLSRITDAIPLPIVMGMVAGVLLQFGLDWIGALSSVPAIAVPMTAAYFLLSAFPSAARRLPPMIASLLTGIAAVYLTADGASVPLTSPAAFMPTVFVPVYSLRAALELVVPLLITVIFAQNSQGIALLRAAGHNPPVNMITAACGIGSIAAAFVGTVATCLTGPVNGILASSGERRHQYVGGVLVALFAVGFGLLAPTVTNLMIAAPAGFIATLGGLALFNVLQGAFTSGFGGTFPKSALVAFLVTVSHVEIANIGAPFWGIVAGLVAAWTLERAHWPAGK